MAKSLVKYEYHGNLKPILQVLMDADVNIIQMPCIESFYYGLEKGLNREPAGRKHYNNEKFKEFCEQKAVEVFQNIQDIQKNGYSVIAILGMEFSPACAVVMQHPPQKGGNPGFFIQALQRHLQNNNMHIPVIGINRRHINATVQKLTTLINTKTQSELKI